jgi:hypothetical protein
MVGSGKHPVGVSVSQSSLPLAFQGIPPRFCFQQSTRQSTLPSQRIVGTKSLPDAIALPTAKDELTLK